MFSRETELRAARSCARVQPSKRADGAGKISAHPKNAETKVWFSWPPVLDLFQPFFSAAASMSVRIEAPPSLSRREICCEQLGGQRLNFILKLAALVISAQRTP